jgi:hypothetical protein
MTPVPHVPNYRATAVREGKFWAVTIHGLPVNITPVTQGTTWKEAVHNTAEVVDLVTEDKFFTVQLRPEDTFAEAAIDAVHAVRDALTAAQTTAISVLSGQDWSPEDIAQALNMHLDDVTSLLASADPEAELPPACAKCRRPFENTTPQGPFCRNCINHCADSEIADHYCLIDRWRRGEVTEEQLAARR